MMDQTYDKYELDLWQLRIRLSLKKKKKAKKKKREVVLNLILRKFQQQIKVSIIINLDSCEIMIIQDFRIYMMVVYNLQSTLNMKYVLRLSFR